jgi:L-aspartate oxidase
VSDLDLLVLGSGVAGLTAAVTAARRDRMEVGVLTKGELHQATTRWAQGGVAAVLGGDPDSTDLHLADTLSAGAGLCDRDAVRVLVDDGPARVNELIAWGAMFDRDAAGEIDLAREGGHSVPRILHAGGAATGAEVERALVDAVGTTAAALFESWFASDLIVEHGRCRGAVALDADGQRHEVRARHVMLATGGAGQIYAVTTNPLQATGDGIAMALRAGVAVADVEFVQFHPTALHHPKMPRPLLSEALRGHGALLRDAAGARFVDELLPRDQVARAMAERMSAQDVDHLWLDATGIERFSERFPTIADALADVGLDPATDWLPIAPAAHYLCGGVVTDLDGATELPGLWACGETACTGVHGANRLASNSLLEGMVFAPRIVEAVAAGREGPRATGAMAALLDPSPRSGGLIAAREVEIPSPVPESDDHGPVPETVADRRAALQMAMSAGAGVVRTDGSLHAARRMVDRVDPLGDIAAPERLAPDTAELGNLATVARAVTTAAAARTESRGGHLRADYPATDEAQRHRIVVRQDVTPTKEQP